MDVLIFIEGVQLGMLIIGAICVRLIRREMSADVGPQLRRVQVQIENLETTVNLALMTRYTELSAGPQPVPPRPRPSGNAGI